MNNEISIYTDGACSGNPGIGGWGVVISQNESIREFSGSYSKTTNNRMEMYAAIFALEKIIELDYKHIHNITVYTDSKYLQNGIMTWIKQWKITNRLSIKHPKSVKNIDLWLALDQLNNNLSPQWVWVKGHANNIGNNRADQLAKLEVQKFKTQ